DDLGRFVVDDAARDLVPQHRHGDPPGITGPGLDVDLVQVAGAIDAVGNGARAVTEPPALGPHVPVDHGQRYVSLQPLQLAEDERAVRPRAGEGDVEVIAAGLGRVAAGAVRRHPL